MGHRAAAGVIFIWIAYVAYLAIRNYRHQKVIYWGWIIAFTLVSLTSYYRVLLIIFTRLNLYIALMHALFITCLFGVLSYFLLLLSRSQKKQTIKKLPGITYNWQLFLFNHFILIQEVNLLFE